MKSYALLQINKLNLTQYWQMKYLRGSCYYWWLIFEKKYVSCIKGFIALVFKIMFLSLVSLWFSPTCYECFV